MSGGGRIIHVEPDFAAAEWQESNRVVQEWLDTADPGTRERFMANRSVILERLGIPEDGAPLAAGFIAPVPDDPMADPKWRAAIERGQELAKEHGW